MTNNKYLPRTPFNYLGVDVFPAEKNSSGIRWYARTTKGTLKADSRVGIKALIRQSQG